MSLGLFLAVVAGGAPVDQTPIPTGITNGYVQPDGTSYYLQPDGTSYYLQP